LLHSEAPFAINIATIELEELQWTSSLILPIVQYFLFVDFSLVNEH
jgi:hypothetical protein